MILVTIKKDFLFLAFHAVVMKYYRFLMKLFSSITILLGKLQHWASFKKAFFFLTLPWLRRYYETIMD